MKRSCRLIGAFIGTAALAACGGATNGLYPSTPLSVRSQPALGPRAANGVTEKLLYSFAGGSGDGAGPVNMILTDVNGVLYGVTEQGG